MAESHPCPNDAQLQSLIDGTLPADVQAALAAHLEICETCRQKLDALAGTSVAIPPSGSAVSEPADRSSALAEAMRRLKADQAAETATVAAISIGGASLSFLAPSANPRHLGRLAGYEVLEVIGRGGMGIVLKTRDPKLERLVAVKVLNPDLATSGPARARFLREARSAAAVTHEHVVTIHAVDDAGELPFLVMEYIVGVSLEDRIRRSGHLRLEEILRIGMQAALGLAAAHAQGLVHRDIKPSNILLENGVERVKITDFGLARVVHEAQITQTNLVAGTPQYMSPEQARGESVDHRSDLFSLGCVLYAMCTGRSPFRAETPTGAIHRVCNDAPRPIREVNPDLPDWLAAIIDRLLEKKPADRFQTADEVAEVLGQYLAHVQQPSRVGVPKGIWRARAIGRGFAGVWKWFASGVATLAVLLLLSFLGWQYVASPRSESGGSKPTPPPPRFTPIDLQQFANRARTQSNDGATSPNTLEMLPNHIEVHGVPFTVGERYLLLGGEKVPGCPAQVSGISVHRKAAKLHFLHGCSWTYGQGTEVGKYRINYEDGSPVELPIINGRHTLNWWQPAMGTAAATRAISAWNGSTEGSSQNGARIEVFACAWENPFPDKPIATIDFERSTLKLPAPFCLGITCDEDRTPLPSEPAVLAFTSREFVGRSTASLTIDGGPPKQLPDVEQRLLLPPGRHTIEVRDRSVSIRRGFVDIEAGGCVSLFADSRHFLFPLPDAQPDPAEELTGQSGGIHAAALSADGKVLLAASSDGALTVWKRDTRTWSRWHVFSVGDQGIRGVAISPDGRWAATAGADTGLRLWKLGIECSEVILEGAQLSASAAAFFPNGQRLVSGTVDGSVDIWDLDNRSKVGSFVACQGRVLGLAFAPDGSVLATCGSRENGVKLWHTESWQLRKTLTGHTAPVAAIAFSANGQMLASASEDSTAKCWSVATGETIRTFVHPQGLHAVAFSRDDRRLAAGGLFHTVAIWDIPSGAPLHDFHAHWADIEFLGFSPDGERLVTASKDNSIRFWPATGLPGPFKQQSSTVLPAATFKVADDWSVSVAIAPRTGGKIAAVNWTGTSLRTWNFSDSSCEPAVTVRNDKMEYMSDQSLLYTPDEATLITCLMREDAPLIGLWDAQRYRLRKAFVADPTPVKKVFAFAAMSLSHDGGMLAVTSQRHGLVAVADLATTSPVWSRVLDPERPSSVFFSPDDRVLAVGTQSGMVLLLDARTGHEIRRLQHGRQAVTAVAFSPDGTLGSANKGGIVRLWTASSFEPIPLPNVHKEAIWSAAFSPDGRLLVTSGGMWEVESLGNRKGEVCLWDVPERKVVARFEAHYGSVTCAVFSPDGKSFATTGRDGKMHLWDVEEVLQKAAVKDTEPEKGEVTAATVSVGKD